MLTFRNQVLEMIAGGASLESTLEALCLKVEERISGACCTVTGVDPAGLLHTLAAPGLPEIYRDAIDGVVAGPEVGSCGAAIYLNKPVTVIDIESDPKWAGFKSLALPLGWKACSSAPVRDDHGKAIAAVALYFKDRRAPNSAEVALLMSCLELCQLAMRHHQGILELKRQATIDALTGLPNRAAFDEAFSSLRCELPGSWALLLVDVDNLKATNDALGHEAGDALLEEASFDTGRVSARVLRSEGTPYGMLPTPSTTTVSTRIISPSFAWTQESSLGLRRCAAWSASRGSSCPPRAFRTRSMTRE